MLNIFSGGCYSKNNIISYNDAALEYSGRWIDTGSGKWTGWAGAPPVRFKVRNTSSIKINAACIDPGNASLCFLTANIDNDPIAPTAFYHTTLAETFTGNRSVTIPMINDGNWHTITIHVGGFIYDTYIQYSKTTITSYQIDFGGEVDGWTQGTKKIQCVGDSWMGTSADWPRLMSTSLYDCNYISAGGMDVATMNTQYNYDYSGTLNTSDVNVDAVIVSFGVNDLHFAISQAAFEASLSSLVDKIRAKQATAKIFLIRVPSNVTTGEDYGKYGTNMSNVAGVKSNCYYINTSSLDATITWYSDTYHLDSKGKQTLANFIKTELIAAGI